MIPLVTERLRLRAFETGDLPFIRQLHAHPDCLRFIPSSAVADEEAAWLPPGWELEPVGE